jgi:hypothetical protein
MNLGFLLYRHYLDLAEKAVWDSWCLPTQQIKNSGLSLRAVTRPAD